MPSCTNRDDIPGSRRDGFYNETFIFCVCGQAVPSPPDYALAASGLEAGLQPGVFPLFKLRSVRKVTGSSPAFNRLE